ncbi:cell division protein SepF [Streptomyces sp. DT2A-34]|uniref:cell division protein SepF n=1 Tax=Streptomyces sp. DT2A-34 TaxID=3051182 RepID=UPI00265C1524|nr:cell division protein SepF [Streptomyces sp. DT2A-34]MDO0911027.1 cell division protein SepF [Streptomyces sp. DT2A-34]
MEGKSTRGEPVNSHDVTDEQWEGLAQVVPLRGRDAWPSAVDHRVSPEAVTEPRRRFVVLRVNVFADARDVAETLMAGIPVLLDLTGAETEVAKRVLDFSTGVVFGLASGMHRVDRNVFLLTPPGTEVSGLMEGAGAPGH